ncbi:TPA: hypothetical protein QDB04_000024 [Burkholderia vietnamiensis]|nr:hypothetical protein [Burkholderia vietnamiensis]
MKLGNTDIAASNTNAQGLGDLSSGYTIHPDGEVEPLTVDSSEQARRPMLYTAATRASGSSAAQPTTLQSRFPGSMSLLKMVSDTYPTLDDAQDALTTLSALHGFAFGYVDETSARTVSFHVDDMPDRQFTEDERITRVFSFIRGHEQE